MAEKIARFTGKLVGNMIAEKPLAILIASGKPYLSLVWAIATMIKNA